MNSSSLARLISTPPVSKQNMQESGEPDWLVYIVPVDNGFSEAIERGARFVAAFLTDPVVHKKIPVTQTNRCRLAEL